MDQWFVYIIKCRDKKLYIGIAKDLNKRVALHNEGKACKFTRHRYPVQLLYQELHDSKSAALKREIALKKLSRPQKFEVINQIPPAC